MKKIVVIVWVVIISTPQWIISMEGNSEAPRFTYAYYKQESLCLKKELQKQEKEHMRLTSEFIAADCPDNNDFTIVQQLFYKDWMCACKKKSVQIEQSGGTLLELANQINELKHKKRTAGITNELKSFISRRHEK